ncbi:MAG: hypothetical protein IT438_12035 [Phycisphaerales bacterium]|nr:hypothetical protein [Phycisphaerales bacterium]
MRWLYLCATAVVFVSLGVRASGAALIASDTFTRVNDTGMGATEFGGFAYSEFSGTGGTLTPADVARIQSNRALFDGGSLGNDPALARLAGVGFDVDVSATVTMVADNYSPAWQTAAGRSNSPVLVLRQGMNFNSQTTRGAISLTLFPDATYRVIVTTQSGTFVGDPNWQFADLTGLVPIGPASGLADTDADGVLESSEPFTMRALAVGDQFTWFMNGVQVGPALSLPAAAVVGVDTAAASNVLFGRNRISSANSAELDIAWDNLNIQTPAPGAAILLASWLMGSACRRRR